MKLPLLTKTQKKILFYLYTFRFLTTNHIQKLLNHKNPHRTQAWLKDLKDKQYIAILETQGAFTDKNKPYVYHLAAKALHVLKENKSCEYVVLEKIYKEKTRKQPFINHCLDLADMYLFFLSRKEPDQELHFFTESNLAGYDYLPDPLPSAYITLKTTNETKRYFLEFFFPYATAGVLRYRFRTYLKYANSGTWESNEEDKPFPTVLFVCPTERLKKHIKFYTESVFKKSYEEKINFFVTSQNILLQSNKEIVWENVSIEAD